MFFDDILLKKMLEIAYAVPASKSPSEVCDKKSKGKHSCKGKGKKTSKVVR
jgi:hypothetical protein